MHNSHSWASRLTNFQHQFGVNLWTGVLNGESIGPFELPQRLNEEVFLNFLENDLPMLLDDINLRLLRRMWFQNDETLCHYVLQVRRYLNEKYPQRWIGRGSEIVRLKPDRLFCMGILQRSGILQRIWEQELMDRLREAVNLIRENRQAF